MFACIFKYINKLISIELVFCLCIVVLAPVMIGNHECISWAHHIQWHKIIKENDGNGMGLVHRSSDLNCFIEIRVYRL